MKAAILNLECWGCDEVATYQVDSGGISAAKAIATRDGWSISKSGSCHCKTCRLDKDERIKKALLLIGTEDDSGRKISIGRAAKMCGVPQSTLFKASQPDR